MSKSLQDLHPYVKSLANKFLAACKAEGIDVLIYQTLRTKEQQDYYYSLGRTRSGKKVTNVKGGYSYHNYGLAFDCVPIINGKAQWNRTDLYKKMGKIGVSLGFEWGGNFKTIVDNPHFQWTGGLTIKDLLAGRRPKDNTSSSFSTLKPENDFVIAVNALSKKGILASPDYWINSAQYNKDYFIKVVITFTKKSSFEEAINYLFDNKIINSKDYWINNQTYSIENIKLLFQKLANSLK